MEALCTEGMFWCVFEATFGFGLAVILVIFFAALLGLFDGRH